MKRNLLSICGLTTLMLFFGQDLCAARLTGNGDYLIVNKATGYYLAGGLDWGTRATLVNKPQFFTLTSQGGGRYTLDSHQSNGGNSHYLGTNLYMDAEATNWTFTEVNNSGYYTIRNNAGYLTGKGPNNTVEQENTQSDASLWELVTMDDIKNRQNNATANSPVDVTAYINDPQLKRNGNTSGYWTITGFNGTGNPQNFREGQDINVASCAESYHSSNGFKVKQTLTGLKAGIYSFSASAFYRQDGNDNSKLPYIYVGSTQSPFPEKSPFPKRNDNNDKDMVSVYESFLAGKYKVAPIFFTVENNASVEIGLAGEDSTMWNIFGQCELMYYGSTFTDEHTSLVYNVGDTIHKDKIDYLITSLKSGDISVSAIATKTTQGSITIPSTITDRRASHDFTFNVTIIPEYAFYDCTNLESVTLSEGLKSIGEYAFQGCTNLRSANVPASVTNIGSTSFQGCTGLTDVENGLRYAGTFLVGAADKTRTSYTVRNRTRFIGIEAFADCEALANITIPSTVTMIGDYAFYGCRSLANVTIPEGETEMRWDAFWGCTGLSDFNIPNTVTRISGYAFSGCTGLTTITIPANVQYIASSAFYGCSNLAEIICKPTTPPESDYEYLSGIPARCKLTVPSGYKSAYETIVPWSSFEDIEAKNMISLAAAPSRGIIQASTTAAEEGETVTLTATPDAGYYLQCVSIQEYTTGEGAQAAPSRFIATAQVIEMAYDAATGNYTGNYVMPDYDVIIQQVKFAAKEVQDIAASDITVSSISDEKQLLTAHNNSTDGGMLTYAVTEGADVIDIDAETGEITVLQTGTATVTITAAESEKYTETNRIVTVTVVDAALIQLVDGMATFYNGTSAYNVPANAKAWTGTIDYVNECVMTHEIADGIIPAGTAVVLTSEEATIELSRCDSEASAIESDLKGTDTYTGGELTGDENIYVLHNGHFVWAISGVLNSGKAYLVYEPTSGSANATAIRIQFNDDNMTAIEQIATVGTSAKTIDLQGRKVKHLHRGSIYLRNGRKMLVK